MVHIVIRIDAPEAAVVRQEGEAEAAPAAPGAATPPSEVLAATVAAAGAQDAGPGPATAAPTITGAPPLPLAAAEPGAPPGAGPGALAAGAAPGTQAEPPPATVTAEEAE